MNINVEQEATTLTPTDLAYAAMSEASKPCKFGPVPGMVKLLVADAVGETFALNSDELDAEASQLQEHETLDKTAAVDGLRLVVADAHFKAAYDKDFAADRLYCDRQSDAFVIGSQLLQETVKLVDENLALAS